MENPRHIHPEGKIDIHNREEQFVKALEKLKEDTGLYPENRKLILAFIRDCRLGKTLKGRAKKKIGSARCLKYIRILRYLDKWFSKQFDDMLERDMEHFICGLDADQIQSTQNRPFSDSTKADIKKAIRKFWKWKDGNNKIYPELVDWIDTYTPVKEIPALKREEVEQLIESCSNSRNKALLMVLFDSGARIEELLNVRLKPEHIFWKESVGCYMIRLEFSKTKPRTISLPLSTASIRKWLRAHPDRDNPQAQLFPISYDNLRMMIGRLGKKVLKKRVTPHILRHSSATFYANKIRNRYKLCYRYGWAMSSKEVDRYVDREGIFEEETSELVKTDEFVRAEKTNQNLKEELILVKAANYELERSVKSLREDLDSVMSGQGILSLLMQSNNHKLNNDKDSIRGIEAFDFILDGTGIACKNRFCGK